MEEIAKKERGDGVRHGEKAGGRQSTRNIKVWKQVVGKITQNIS